MGAAGSAGDNQILESLAGDHPGIEQAAASSSAMNDVPSAITGSNSMGGSYTYGDAAGSQTAAADNDQPQAGSGTGRAAEQQMPDRSIRSPRSWLGGADGSEVTGLPSNQASAESEAVPSVAASASAAHAAASSAAAAAATRASGSTPEGRNRVFTIKVKSTDGTVRTEKVPASHTAAQLKIMLSFKTGVPVDGMKLILKGKVLKDADPLDLSLTEDNQTIHMVQRPPAPGASGTATGARPGAPAGPGGGGGPGGGPPGTAHGGGAQTIPAGFSMMSPFPSSTMAGPPVGVGGIPTMQPMPPGVGGPGGPTPWMSHQVHVQFGPGTGPPGPELMQLLSILQNGLPGVLANAQLQPNTAPGTRPAEAAPGAQPNPPASGQPPAMQAALAAATHQAHLVAGSRRGDEAPRNANNDVPNAGRPRVKPAPPYPPHTAPAPPGGSTAPTAASSTAAAGPGTAATSAAASVGVAMPSVAPGATMVATGPPGTMPGAGGQSLISQWLLPGSAPILFNGQDMRMNTSADLRTVLGSFRRPGDGGTAPQGQGQGQGQPSTSSSGPGGGGDAAPGGTGPAAGTPEAAQLQHALGAQILVGPPMMGMPMDPFVGLPIPGPVPPGVAPPGVAGAPGSAPAPGGEGGAARRHGAGNNRHGDGLPWRELDRFNLNANRFLGRTGHQRWVAPSDSMVGELLSFLTHMSIANNALGIAIAEVKATLEETGTLPPRQRVGLSATMMAGARALRSSAQYFQNTDHLNENMFAVPFGNLAQMGASAQQIQAHLQHAAAHLQGGLPHEPPLLAGTAPAESQQQQPENQQQSSAQQQQQQPLTQQQQQHQQQQLLHAARQARQILIASQAMHPQSQQQHNVAAHFLMAQQAAVAAAGAAAAAGTAAPHAGQAGTAPAGSDTAAAATTASTSTGLPSTAGGATGAADAAHAKATPPRQDHLPPSPASSPMPQCPPPPPTGARPPCPLLQPASSDPLPTPRQASDGSQDQQQQQIGVTFRVRRRGDIHAGIPEGLPEGLPTGDFPPEQYVYGPWRGGELPKAGPPQSKLPPVPSVPPPPPPKMMGMQGPPASAARPKSPTPSPPRDGEAAGGQPSNDGAETASASSTGFDSNGMGMLGPLGQLMMQQMPLGVPQAKSPMPTDAQEQFATSSRSWFETAEESLALPQPVQSASESPPAIPRSPIRENEQDDEAAPSPIGLDSGNPPSPSTASEEVADF